MGWLRCSWRLACYPLGQSERGFFRDARSPPVAVIQIPLLRRCENQLIYILFSFAEEGFASTSSDACFGGTLLAALMTSGMASCRGRGLPLPDCLVYGCWRRIRNQCHLPAHWVQVFVHLCRGLARPCHWASVF